MIQANPLHPSHRWRAVELKEVFKDQDLKLPPVSAGSSKPANLCMRNRGFVFLMVKLFVIHQKIA